MQIKGELNSSLDKIINTELQTFVQNRVAEIRKISCLERWNYCFMAVNNAVFLSRFSKKRFYWKFSIVKMCSIFIQAKINLCEKNRKIQWIVLIYFISKFEKEVKKYIVNFNASYHLIDSVANDSYPALLVW